jgi:hypothetical protein
MAGPAKGGGMRMFKLTEIDEIDETEQVACLPSNEAPRFERNGGWRPRQPPGLRAAGRSRDGCER